MKRHFLNTERIILSNSEVKEFPLKSEMRQVRLLPDLSLDTALEVPTDATRKLENKSK